MTAWSQVCLVSGLPGLRSAWSQVCQVRSAWSQVCLVSGLPGPRSAWSQVCWSQVCLVSGLPGLRSDFILLSILLEIQGVPRNMTVARRLESCFKYLNSFVTTDNQLTSLKMWNSWNINHKMVFVNTTGVIKNLVQISFLLNKTIIVESWTKVVRSRVILQAQKMQTTFWKCQDSGYFVIINSRILLLLFWKMKTGNYTNLRGLLSRHVSY